MGEKFKENLMFVVTIALFLLSISFPTLQFFFAISAVIALIVWLFLIIRFRLRIFIEFVKRTYRGY